MWTTKTCDIVLCVSETLIPAWTLGDRLAKARETGQVSRAEMADYLGRSTNTITNYENGHTTPPAGVVRAWALRCNVAYEWLVDGTGDQHVSAFPWNDVHAEQLTFADVTDAHEREILTAA